MRTLLLCIIAMNLIRIKGASPQHQVVQTPAAMMVQQNSPGGNLSCKHRIPNYDTILWYQRSRRDHALKLIAFLYYSKPTVEESFTGRFAIDGAGETWSRLDLLALQSPNDTGEYYCAAKFVLSSLVIHQSPAHLLLTAQDHGDVSLHCNHGDTNYPYMFWYQHKTVKGGHMVLVGMIYHNSDAQLESDFKARFGITGDAKADVKLTISGASRAPPGAWSSHVVAVSQPRAVTAAPGANVTLPCAHGAAGAYYLLWYWQRRHGARLVLLGHLYAALANMEKEFASRVLLEGKAASHSTLTVLRVAAADAGRYYCSVRTHGAALRPRTRTKTSAAGDTRDAASTKLGGGGTPKCSNVNDNSGEMSRLILSGHPRNVKIRVRERHDGL
ncbi:unnamed protein product [Merluccius merluccius]